jgi:hypothetical protein
MVRFADTSVMYTSTGPVKVLTKVNDGLRPESDLFNSLILSFFARGGSIGDHILQSPRLLYIDRTRDLLKRMHQKKIGQYTSILSHGGGGSTKVSHIHRPYLKTLLSWLIQAAPAKGTREWMLEQPKSGALLSQEGLVFIKDIVDGLIPPFEVKDSAAMHNPRRAAAAFLSHNIPGCMAP